ncbi:MAG: hypothetical protein JWP62_3815 [Blastococcus sp.]|nr:hypothetical protein [Blastococcus sp.]
MFVGGSTPQVPGLEERPVTPVVAARPRAAWWIRRLLPLAALVFGGWALLAAAAGTARADEAEPAGAVTCEATAPRPGLTDGLAALMDDELPTATLPADGLEGRPPLEVGLPRCDVPPPLDEPGPPVPAPAPVPVTPAAVPDPPDPGLVDVPIVEIPPVVPEQVTTPPPAPDPVPPAPVVMSVVIPVVQPAPVVVPSVVEEAAAVAADPVTPVAAEDEAAEAENAALADSALVEAAVVSEARLLPEAAVCAVPEPGTLDTADLSGVPFSGPPLGASSGGSTFAAVAATSTTGGTVTPAPAGRNAAPGSPAGPLPPLNLPLPAPAAPTCPSAAAASGTSASGTGHETHADSTYAVLDTRFAAAFAHGTVSATSGFAGDIVGGADDPGVRPG